MFATPNYADAMSEAQRKRAREDEEDLGSGSASFGEHRNKRIQCLPLRTSPQSSRQWPTSITPLNSDSDEHLPRSHFSPWSSSPAMSSQPQPTSSYSEMDMMDSSQLQQSPSLQIQNEGGNGRIPTPLQPSFAAQVRGQQWAGPGPAVKTLNGVVNMGHHHSGLDDDHIPRTIAAEADWQTVQNNRRLPSPISEGDDCMSNGESLDIMHDHDCQDHDFTDASGQPSPPHAMEHPNAMMDIESQSTGENDEDPTTPSPSRRGHIRSRHTVNNWTWQPGMKKSFSIGYRSDCEKCRLKVPGHFNHIIIT